MRIIFFVLMCCLLVSNLAIAKQDTGAMVKKIQTNVSYLNKNKLLNKKSIDYIDGSEGGEGFYYCDKNKVIRKIVSTDYGETGKNDYEFYFDESNSLIFANVKETFYQEAINSDKPVKIKKIKNNKYYFNNAKAIKITQGNNSLSGHTIGAAEKDVLSAVQSYMDTIKKSANYCE